MKFGDVHVKSQNQQNNGDFDKNQVIQQLTRQQLKIEELLAKSNKKNQKEFKTIKRQIKDFYKKLESLEDTVETQTEQNQQHIKTINEKLAIVKKKCTELDDRIRFLEGKGSLFISESPVKHKLNLQDPNPLS